MSQITYHLLLSLYHGSGAVVERLSDKERDALRIETPLARLLQRVKTGEERRHIILTGNAGDGKSFMLCDANLEETPNLKIISDASSFFDPSLDPIVRLSRELSEALERGLQIVMAINRGQLERLSDQLSAEAVGPLSELLRDTGRLLTLSERWTHEEREVITVDLGLQDTLNSSVVQLALDRAMRADVSACVVESQAAYHEAVTSLKSPHIKARVQHHFEELRATGEHITMRQLWSYISYMLTGGRSANDTSPLTLKDSLYARMFGAKGEGLLFDLSRTLVDPSQEVSPSLIKKYFDGELSPEVLRTYPGLKVISEHFDLNKGGIELLQVINAHSPSNTLAQRHDDPLTFYGKIVDQLRVEKHHSLQGSWVRDIVRHIFRALDLPVDEPMRLWRRLCYNVERWEIAPLASSHTLKLSALSLQLPLPSLEAQAALEGRWRPPFIWLTHQSEDGREVKLRLTPSLFASLWRPNKLNARAKHALWGWLSKVGEEGPSNEVTLYSSQLGEQIQLLKPSFGGFIEVKYNAERRSL